MANKIVVTIVVLIVLVVAVIGVVLLKDYLGKKVVGEEEELTITEKKPGVIATKELSIDTEEELLSEIDKLVEEQIK